MSVYAEQASSCVKFLRMAFEKYPHMLNPEHGDILRYHGRKEGRPKTRVTTQVCRSVFEQHDAGVPQVDIALAMRMGEATISDIINLKHPKAIVYAAKYR